MADLLGAGNAWLEKMRRRHRATPVSYRQGDTTAQLDATIGRTIFRLTAPMAGVERIESRDYLFSADEFPFPEPKRGDRITENGFIYEVMAPGGEPAWRWSDPDRLAYRIHTKHVGKEPAP